MADDPQTVRRWVVAWSEDGAQAGYALALPLGWAVDLGNALDRLRASGEVATVFLWPCVPGTPVSVYVLARGTLQRWFRSDFEIENWRQILTRADFDLPDIFELLELSERSKARRAA